MLQYYLERIFYSFRTRWHVFALPVVAVIVYLTYQFVTTSPFKYDIQKDITFDIEDTASREFAQYIASKKKFFLSTYIMTPLLNELLSDLLDKYKNKGSVFSILDKRGRDKVQDYFADIKRYTEFKLIDDKKLSIIRSQAASEDDGKKTVDFIVKSIFSSLKKEQKEFHKHITYMIEVIKKGNAEHKVALLNTTSDQQKKNLEILIKKNKKKLKRYSLILKKLKKSGMSVNAKPDSLSRVVNSTFSLPGETLQNTLKLFLIALLLAVVIIIIWELISQTLHSEYQVGHYLKTNILGDLPLLKNPTKDTKTAEGGPLDISAISSYYEFRRIYSAIFPKDLPRDNFSILFVSAKNNEGKSLTASVFASTLAKEKNTKILVLDFHWQNPGVHNFLGITKRITIENYLEKIDTPTELVKPTNIPNVDVICAPEVDLNQQEWKKFHKTNLNTLLSRLHETYPYIIIDGAPIFTSKKPVIDPIKVASVSSGVILVLLTKKIKKKFIKSAKITIEEVTKNLLGVIINNQYNPMRQS
jgi:Mrp family chromosome partitioning ATPase